MKKNITCKITATPNYKNKTFTIRKTFNDGTKYKYRTTHLSKEKFKQELNNTENDWKQFLHYSNDYYTVK
jgi:hypothetical protein